MTKYKLTEKAIAEKFDMLCGLTINMINLRVNEVIEERVSNGDLVPVPYRMIVELSSINVVFKDPNMNKLFDIMNSYKFQVYSEDLEEEEEEFPKELKKITTGVWYDVKDIINGEYDIDEAINYSVDVLACEESATNLKYKDNFTGNHHKYRVGYLYINDDGYVFCSLGQESPIKTFVRLMFIPAETKEE